MSQFLAAKNLKVNRRIDIKRASLVSVCTLLPLAQLWLFWGGLSIFPYSDEWHFVDVLPNNDAWSFIKWMFTLHGEHLIPLQKILQKSLLAWSGYDFRITVLANMLMVSAACLLILYSLFRIRGSHSWFDFIIPILIFSPVAGFSNWGFHFQFSSSVFFFSLALSMLASGVHNRCTLAVFASVFLALCGLNGLVLSTILVLAAAFEGIVIQREKKCFVAVVAYLAVVVLVFKLSAGVSASHGNVTIQSVTSLYFGMLGASFISAPLVPPAFFSAVIGVILVAVCGVYFRDALKKRCILDWQILMVFAAPFVLFAAVAVGRSQYYGEWQPTMAWHYGTLLSLLPVSLWLLIARIDRRWLTLIAGVPLLAVTVWSHQAAFVWKKEYVRDNSENKLALVRSISDANIPIIEVVQQNWKELFFTNEATFDLMERKMPVLRKAYSERFN